CRPRPGPARLWSRLGRAAPGGSARHPGAVAVGPDQPGALRALRLRAPDGGGTGPVRALLPPRLPDRARVHARRRGRCGRGARRGGAGAMTARMPWQAEGWRGWVDAAAGIDPAACLAAAAGDVGRASRHARTLSLSAAGGALFVKTYPAPGGWRAARALRMGQALAGAGLAAPEVVAAARRGGAGLLVMRDAGGEDLLAAVARRRARPGEKRALLRR